MGSDGNVRSVGVGLFLVVVGLGLCASCAVSSVVCRVVYVCGDWLGARGSVVGWLHICSRASLVPASSVDVGVVGGAGRPGCSSDIGVFAWLGRQFPCWYGWVCVGAAGDGGR